MGDHTPPEDIDPTGGRFEKWLEGRDMVRCEEGPVDGGDYAFRDFEPYDAVEGFLDEHPDLEHLRDELMTYADATGPWFSNPSDPEPEPDFDDDFTDPEEPV